MLMLVLAVMCLSRGFLYIMSRLDVQLSLTIIILILDLPHIIKQHLSIDPSQPKLVS
jgi:hypothetical protein